MPSLTKSMCCEVSMQQFFEEAFIGEGFQIVVGANFVEDRQRDSPRHPLSWHIRQVPATTEECFDNLNLRLRQAIQISGEVHRLERTTQRWVTNWRSKDFRKCRCFSF